MRRWGGEKRKTKHCTTETSESFCNPLGGNLSCTPPRSTAAALTLHCGRWERRGSIYLSFHLGQVSLCSNWTLGGKWPDDWPETQAGGALAPPALCQNYTNGNKRGFPCHPASAEGPLFSYWTVLGPHLHFCLCKPLWICKVQHLNWLWGESLWSRNGWSSDANCCDVMFWKWKEIFFLLLFLIQDHFLLSTTGQGNIFINRNIAELFETWQQSL